MKIIVHALLAYINCRQYVVSGGAYKQAYSGEKADRKEMGRKRRGRCENTRAAREETWKWMRHEK